MKTKTLTLHRLSIALQTIVLMISACVIVSQQRDNQRLRKSDYAIDGAANYKKLYEEGQISPAAYFRMLPTMTPTGRGVQIRQTACGTMRVWDDDNSRYTTP